MRSRSDAPGQTDISPYNSNIVNLLLVNVVSDKLGKVKKKKKTDHRQINPENEVKVRLEIHVTENFSFSSSS